MDLPALYNPNDMDHKFSILSQPAWSTFRNDKFIFEPDLDEFLQGVIKIRNLRDIYELECKEFSRFLWIFPWSGEPWCLNFRLLSASRL